MNKSLKLIRDDAVGAYEKLGERYHSRLSDELGLLYCYLPDSGHCILCMLKEHYQDAMLFEEMVEFLIPLPVKTVQRSYVLQQGIPIVSGVKYDSMIGAQVPEDDYEFNNDTSNSNSNNDLKEMWEFCVSERVDERLIAQLVSRFLWTILGFKTHIAVAIY